MAGNLLSLPTDIAWKLLVASLDMYATDITQDLPVKWRSSLAIFYSDPQPDLDGDPDELTAFLKVVATITGYQPDGDEIDRDLLSTKDLGWKLIQNFDQLTSEYYPALSALVQVAVFPHDGDWQLSQYPYMVDFEPKKREVVELVSDAGETLTQSMNTLNVRKGTTNTDSTEIANIDHGSSFNQNFQYAGTGGGTSVSNQRDVGNRSVLGGGVENVVTTDASREKRESFSHTTNLSQLWQVLNSYHAGTNRAVFLLNARPHFVDSEFTFVKGPRRLEGIQEFFLVVRRPKTMKEICVKAVLETAHLRESDTQVSDAPTPKNEGSVTMPLQGIARSSDLDFNVQRDILVQIDIPFGDGFTLDDTKGGAILQIHNDQNDTQTQCIVPAGIELHVNTLRTAGGTDLNAVPKFKIYPDKVRVSSYISGWYEVSGKYNGEIDAIVTVHTVATGGETPTSHVEHHVDLFITGRQVASCFASPALDDPAPTIDDHLPYVAYETGLSGDFVQELNASKEAGRGAVAAANAVSRQVSDEMIASFRSIQRYPAHQVDFVHTRFALRDLMDGIDPARLPGAAEPLSSLSNIPAELKTKIQEVAPNLTAADATRQSPDSLGVRIGASRTEARRVIGQVLGLRPSAPPEHP